MHGGITAALVRKVSNGKTVAQTRVFVDGPYGGIPVDLKGYDRVMLLAGGSGSTTIIPVLNDLVAESSGKKIDFVVAVRERGKHCQSSSMDTLTNASRRCIHMDGR